MTLPFCNRSNSILETDLEVAAQQNTLVKITIMETPEGFYLSAVLRWDETKTWYVTTRRDREEPKLFSNLNRLNERLKELNPNGSVEIVRNQTVPRDPARRPTPPIGFLVPDPGTKKDE